jgi:acetyl-CoA carboxylase biotin carboxyl carrier protein
MVSLDELKKYIDFLSTTDIEELEIVAPEGEKILLKRSEVLSNVTALGQQQNVQTNKTEVALEPQQQVVEKKEFVITSPMVGKFLLSTSKDHPPFVFVGAKVNQGQKVAIIETMRIFRDVVSPKNGVVKKILVEDGQFVEYNQPLVVLELEEEQNI